MENYNGRSYNEREDRRSRESEQDIGARSRRERQNNASRFDNRDEYRSNSSYGGVNAPDREYSESPGYGRRYNDYNEPSSRRRNLNEEYSSRGRESGLSGYERDWDDHNVDEDSSSARRRSDRSLARSENRSLRGNYMDDIDRSERIYSEDGQSYYDTRYQQRSGEFGNGGRYSTQSWSLTGPFTGKGPKGYQRSDDKIKEEACDRLERCGSVDASEIDISCKQGIITLSGSVENREMKRRAEDCVEDLYGVNDVMNSLSVKNGMHTKSSDQSSKKEKGDNPRKDNLN